ncbi:MAG: response regulator [bacterium]
METKSILIVDDEKNIRMTMSKSLESLEMPLDVAVNGEEALQKLRDRQYFLVFLDIKMPGIDGITVLEEINKKWPKTRVVIITAHGNIDLAVESMKLGAVDFIQKPFSPSEIRDIATTIIDRESLNEEEVNTYPDLIELAKRHITDRSFNKAQEVVKKAMSLKPDKPEAFNLLGALFEIQNKNSEALKFYRVALDIDPTYKPAQTNLQRASLTEKSKNIDIGDNK